MARKTVKALTGESKGECTGGKEVTKETGQEGDNERDSTLQRTYSRWIEGQMDDLMVMVRERPWLWFKESNECSPIPTIE